MLERSYAEEDGCRTDRMQYRTAVGQDGCSTPRMQDGCSTVYTTDAGQVGCNHAGQVEYRRGDLQDR